MGCIWGAGAAPSHRARAAERGGGQGTAIVMAGGKPAPRANKLFMRPRAIAHCAGGIPEITPAVTFKKVA